MTTKILSKTSFILIFLIFLCAVSYSQGRIYLRSYQKNIDVEIKKITTDSLWYVADVSTKKISLNEVIVYKEDMRDTTSKWIYPNPEDAVNYPVYKNKNICNRYDLWTMDSVLVSYTCDSCALESEAYSFSLTNESKGKEKTFDRNRSKIVILYLKSDPSFRKLSLKICGFSKNSMCVSDRKGKKEFFWIIPIDSIATLGYEPAGLAIFRISAATILVAISSITIVAVPVTFSMYSDRYNIRYKSEKGWQIVPVKTNF